MVLYKFFKSKIQQGDDKKFFDEFKNQIDAILYEYIKTDLIACENTLTAVTHRQTRVATIVQDQKKLKDLCQEDIEEEQLKRAELYFQDKENLAGDSLLKGLLF